MKDITQTFLLLVASFSLSAGMALLPTACDAAPPTVAPKDTPVDKERFSDAKLTLKDEVVKDRRVILEKGKEYEFSGSFQLTQLDDETDEYVSVQRVRQTLILKFMIDGQKSGYGLGQDGMPVREVITGQGFVKESQIDASNVIHFKGKLKAPKQIGEHELRLAFTPEEAEQRVYIFTRLVKVVEPNGT